MIIGKAILIAICIIGAFVSFILSMDNKVKDLDDIEYKVDLSNYGWVSVGFIIAIVICIRGI